MSTTAAATDTRAAPDAAHAGVVLAIASLGFFLITLDISIVNVALADVRADLGGGTTLQQWVIDGYTLLFAALLLLAGTVSDRIGAKTALTIGIVVFGLASVACSIAPSGAALIAARCVQGAGAAVMLPASMALIREAFPDPRRRAGALGVWAVGGAVAGLVGQPLGGVLTTLDWRWVFGINIPVCLGMLACLTVVTASARRPARFDLVGQVVSIVALTALVFGLIEGGHGSFGAAPVVSALTVAAAGVILFVWLQARVAHPMMPLTLFRARGVRLALPVGFAFMVGNYGNVFVVSLYLQQELGLSPLRAGLMFLPSAAFAIVGNLTSGPITNRFGARLPVVTGQVMMVVGLTAAAATADLRSPWVTAACLIPIGAGGSLAMPAVTGVVLDGVAAELTGTASAVFNTFRQVGGAVAIAVFGALVAAPYGFVGGMRTSLVIAAALLLLTAAISLIALSNARPEATPTVDLCKRGAAADREADELDK